MKKILIIAGSPRIGQSQRVVKRFVELLEDRYKTEVLYLKDLNLQMCKGCAVCLSRGEDLCPLKDDKTMILEKMDRADCIVFTTPNYSLNVSGLMKNFFDRFAFVYHRPRFFKKVFSSIITQGVYGGDTIEKYFKDTVGFWGGIFVKGSIFTLTSGAYNPGLAWSKNEQRMIERGLQKQIQRIEGALSSVNKYSPSLFRVLIFHLTRSGHKYSQQDNKDHNHFKEMGWFESDYFYPVRLSIFKKLLGKIIDAYMKRVILKSKGLTSS